ncbi:cylicin-2-like [Palaemon carinicauda]|uniref:cylicin-2-like n=1 Tax=Palaemon carinicauda TaxID=392227 RepID=UPI0035B5D482
MEEQLMILREELRLAKERDEKLLLENARLSCENEEMQKEMKALKGSVEKVEEVFEMRMQENEARMEKRMEAMMGQVMGMMKTLMGEGAVRGVSSASGNGLLVEEKTKVSDNGEGSDSDIEDKGIKHSKDEQKFNKKNGKKGKSNVKREKKKGQDEGEDDHEWVKEVSKKKGKKGMIKDRNSSVELDSLYLNEEEGNKKGLGSEDSSENEVGSL